jgi:hypothetical protein
MIPIPENLKNYTEENILIKEDKERCSFVFSQLHRGNEKDHGKIIVV